MFFLNMNRLVNLSADFIITARHYAIKDAKSKSYKFAAVRNASDKTESPTKKKKTPETKVTLISNDQTVSVVDLMEAQKLSTRRDLRLVQIKDIDAKSKRPIYRLISNEQYIQEGTKIKSDKQQERKNNSIKGDKLISISTRIGEHDLLTRIKNMKRQLKKHFEVRIVITCDEANFDRADEIHTEIEKQIENYGKIVQKRTKGNLMKFQIIPNKDDPALKEARTNESERSLSSVEPGVL